MKLHFLRNATLIIEHKQHRILVDPMLGKVGSLPSYSFIRHKSRRNPMVPLPDGAQQNLEGLTAALVTHCQLGHSDHLDGAAKKLLLSKKIPTYCRLDDESFIGKRGIPTVPLKDEQRQPFFDGYITPIPTVHGYGWIARFMGPGVGYFLELPDAPSLYISGDTVLTKDVRHCLKTLRPDIAVVAAGNASLDIGKDILMSLDEIMEFIRLAPGQVIANHLEAINHCPVKRTQLRDLAQKSGVSEKLLIPADGETLTFSKQPEFA
ncbi:MULTISPECIES: MBL fold metallo-hydrolase [unclassified Pseudovibrio]|uniref:MBL fold metallo-hydrolase n=1 Tax=unclassified Pseudovibrio TaxID=2627060 RepID=UPI0007B2460E|nr:MULTISPECIES: MBL fold metallo-hydrolase [unclassified Pseudovibrio]KZL00287.1 metal-dependent hydrolase [Pseudovibrio sp. W74]KZL11683.1 metal-dependent hydrolase [Pseudovibrio sp. Ad14]